MLLSKLFPDLHQVKALLHKDFLVRWRLWWMTLVQLVWPCMVFLLLLLIRLKFGPEYREDCQFPTRQLPSKNNVLASFYSIICTLENKCMSTEHYEEYTKFENAPMKPVIDIIQTFINDEKLYNAIIELPEKHNFINAVTVLVTGGHVDEIRENVQKVIALVPTIETYLNGSFDIKKMFSDRKTFVKSGFLLCGQPFPNTETIPLVNDILYSDDFSEVNDDELNAMPTKYCKKLYLDVTSTNQGKLTWSVIKPIIHGKILYAPNNEDTRIIMQNSNTTFEELGKLKNLSIAIESVLTKLRIDVPFQKSLDSLLVLAQSPFVRSIIGDDFNIDEIKAVIERIRTDSVIYDVIQTIKNILECLSVDRFVATNTANELQTTAFDLNKERLFYGAVYFNKTSDENIVYQIHMDTDKTQPTFENKKRFWFPGPDGNMLNDMKYHRGFLQLKHTVDMGLIKFKKHRLNSLGLLTSHSTTTPKSPFKLELFNGDDDIYEDDDDDWFITENNNNKENDTMTHSGLITGVFNGLMEEKSGQLIDDTTEIMSTTLANTEETTTESEIDLNATESVKLSRIKRQGLLDLFETFSSHSTETVVHAETLKYFTKQFPYPAYTHDDFKTGLYLGQAIQVAFFLGLVVEILSCVRHRIWMLESKNSMIMRCMGLRKSSEVCAWIIITSIELVIIFAGILIILYSNGILQYTNFFFIAFYLIVFGACLVSFCNMCSTFFTSATIGAVATSIIFFISFCPYIIVLLFDAMLNATQNFFINVCFTTAFAHGWNHIMRMEVQQIGFTFTKLWQQGLSGECGFAIFMMILDACIYIFIGNMVRRYKKDDSQFIELQRSNMESNIGAKFSNVCKLYDDGKLAVDDINLLLPRNQVTCLLGRNGAGKSTIIKMLTGQVVQTSGHVELAKTAKNSCEYDKIGLCSQNNILIPQLTAREHLELYGKIKLKYNYMAQVEKTLKSLNFDNYESYQISKLSGGYQRRLCVAIAFLGSPNVVILDEPCNGVDIRARKDIWDLIQCLKHGRSVLLATHFLDEAEYLSDSIIMLANGSVIATHTPDTLKVYSTNQYELSFKCHEPKSSVLIRTWAEQMLIDYRVWEEKNDSSLICLEISYEQKSHSILEFFKNLETLQSQNHITDLRIKGKNLEHLFKNMDHQTRPNKVKSNGHVIDFNKTITTTALNNEYHAKQKHAVNNMHLSSFVIMRHLLWKRLVHFSRNYRMLLTVLVLPALFELIAMWFVKYRVEDDFDKVLNLSRDLYPGTMQFLSNETSDNVFVTDLYNNLDDQCLADTPCVKHNNSEKVFRWLLNTNNDFLENRYGGYSLNASNAFIWYNNKGYHAMVSWLNDFNSYLMQTELNDSRYSISTYNEPWKLEFAELSTTSLLRQIGDSCMAFVLLIAFSLIVAVAVIYLVNERMKGEKLQQRLCGVNVSTYWLVAFIWDYLILILGICICSIVMLCFSMPVFVARQQLCGFIVLVLFYGIASIPAIHVLEKCFTDASVAIVTVFSMNVIIPMFTMAFIVLLGVIGDSPVWDDFRYSLNRAFLIFPQHALGDGLLELCKNYMVALVFQRYDIDSYKHPVFSDLLRYHFIALFVVGAFFALLNVCLESGLLHNWRQSYIGENKYKEEELKTISISTIQNSISRNDKVQTLPALTVSNLCKYFTREKYVLRNVSFNVKSGECLGLLGRNGAGKSTIFKILSGQMKPSSGSISFINKEISYCPQTNTLDDLLTVRECLEFYGRLRRINDIPKFVHSILESFQLEPQVLVKNLSGGNRRKLTVATACCGKTSVVLMDEPTSDMDPMTRAVVYRVIHELLGEGRAVVLTSHTISEIDDICDRIVVLKEGQLLLSNNSKNLKLEYGSFYSVSVYCDANKTTDIIKELRKRFPQCVNLMALPRNVTFRIKVGQQHEHERKNKNVDISLAELFRDLAIFIEEYDNTLRYMISHCRLDAIFENILDSNEPTTYQNGNTTSTEGGRQFSALSHNNGYVETEITT